MASLLRANVPRALCPQLAAPWGVSYVSPGVLSPPWLTALSPVMIDSVQRSETKPGMCLFCLLEPNRPSLCRAPQQPHTVGKAKVLPEKQVHKPGPRLPITSLLLAVTSGLTRHGMAGLTGGPIALPGDLLRLFRILHSKQLCRAGFHFSLDKNPQSGRGKGAF